MKNKYLLTATAIGAFMMTMGMTASVQAAQSQGDSSLELGGSFFHAQDAEVGTLNLDFSYGYFTSDSLEFGLIQSLGYSIIDDADETDEHGRRAHHIPDQFIGARSMPSCDSF